MKTTSKILILLLYLGTNQWTYSQERRYSNLANGCWYRFPTESEIQKALIKFKQETKDKTYKSVASSSISKVVKYSISKYSFRNSPFFKYHGIGYRAIENGNWTAYTPNHPSGNYKQYLRYIISRLCIVYTLDGKQIEEWFNGGTKEEPFKKHYRIAVLHYNPNNDTFYFFDSHESNEINAFSLQDAYQKLTKKPKMFITGTNGGDFFLSSNIDSKAKIISGWAPADYTPKSQPNISSTPTNNSDSNIPWGIIVGASLGAAAVLAIRKRLKKKKKNKDSDKEDSGYILQLSQEQIQLTPQKPVTLETKVWKITETTKKITPAVIKIHNPEPALKINPHSGRGHLVSQLMLNGTPQQEQFALTVTAQAGGTQKQHTVHINAQAKKRIVFETAPHNKRYFRPNINDYLTLYAQVVDETNTANEELTQNIVFSSSDEWAIISDTMLQEGWLLVNIDARGPDGADAPPEISVQIKADITDKNSIVTETLSENCTLQLNDCYLRTDDESCIFANNAEQKTLEFYVWVEDAGEEKDWNFKVEYIDNPHYTESQPIADVIFSKESETEIKVQLQGPNFSLSKDKRSVSQCLKIEVAQKDEEPLWLEYWVSIIKGGLTLQKGFSNTNQVKLHATEPLSKNLDFGIHRINSETNSSYVDKESLPKLRFELQETDTITKNILDILQPTFVFDDFVTNNPLGRYILETKEDIPGYGEVYDVKYKVYAPTQPEDVEEDFTREFILKVKTNDVGRKVKTWEQAYAECKYMIDEYVPNSDAQQKLTEILEKQKHFLDAEGLTELRNRIGRIAADLILAEGAEGYKSVEAWANRILTTLEWTEWAGDICFQVLASYFLKGAGAAGASMLKAEIIDAVKFFIYEKDRSAEAFVLHQVDKFLPYLMSATKGRLLSVENLQAILGTSTKAKVAAWIFYISGQFLYNLYQTKSMIEAAKQTARELRDEVIIDFLGGHLRKKYGSDLPELTKKIEKVQSERVQKTLKNLEEQILKNRLGGKFLERAKVLEIMKDPALVRTIKKYGSADLKKAFDGPRQKIYRQHDRDLIKQIARERRMNIKDIKVDDFRTPGVNGNSLNTDRDYRLLRRVIDKNGTESWVEMSRKTWQDASQRIFGQLTDKPPHISDADWADLNQQRATDWRDSEACYDYTDQGIDPKTGERIQLNESNIQKVKAGKAVLKNPDSLGEMYKNKVRHAGHTPEAYAQAKKATHTLDDVKKGYGKQGYETPPRSERLQKAIDHINQQTADVDMTPEKMRQSEAKLKELGYDGGLEDVLKDIGNEFSSYKNVQKKGIFDKIFN